MLYSSVNDYRYPRYPEENHKLYLRKSFVPKCIHGNIVAKQVKGQNIFGSKMWKQVSKCFCSEIAFFRYWTKLVIGHSNL